MVKCEAIYHRAFVRVARREQSVYIFLDLSGKGVAANLAPATKSTPPIEMLVTPTQ